MSDQNNEYNNDAPPRKGPEPSIKQGGYSGSGDLVTMYQAQQGGGAESFPVLQAFQDYIDAERKQARKRVVQLSIAFAAILGVVVVGFLTAGVAILRNTTNMQTKLMEIVAERNIVPVQTQPVQTQPAQVRQSPITSPVLEESIREMSRVLAKMQERSEKPDEKVASVESKPAPVSAPAASVSVDPAVEALHAELAAMKAQSRKMESELVSLRRNSKTSSQQPAAKSTIVEEALAKARQTAMEKAAADKAAAAVAAAEAEKKRLEEEKKRIARIETEKALAVKIAEKRAEAERQTAANTIVKPAVAGKASVSPKIIADAKYPAANKVPPVPSADVKNPAPPEKMAAQCISLKTGSGGDVPWRIFVPE